MTWLSQCPSLGGGGGGGGLMVNNEGNIINIIMRLLSCFSIFLIYLFLKDLTKQLFNGI